MTETIEPRNEIKEIRNRLKSYTVGMILPKEDLLNLSDRVKLQVLQRTPESVVKQRRVGSQMVNYVDIGYIERALNFVSNFNRGCKVTNQGFKEYTRMKGDKEQKVFDAWVLADFYIFLDGKKIERSIFGTRQMFDNPAISDYSVLEAARSQATKGFADTLGIASDKITIENKSLQEAREKAEDQTITILSEGFGE